MATVDSDSLLSLILPEKHTWGQQQVCTKTSELASYEFFTQQKASATQSTKSIWVVGNFFFFFNGWLFVFVTLSGYIVIVYSSIHNDSVLGNYRTDLDTAWCITPMTRYCKLLALKHVSKLPSMYLNSQACSQPFQHVHNLPRLFSTGPSTYEHPQVHVDHPTKH